jgi:hypothetical protein
LAQTIYKQGMQWLKIILLRTLRASSIFTVSILLLLALAGCRSRGEAESHHQHAAGDVGKLSNPQAAPEDYRAADKASPITKEWSSLFDGKTLKGWAITDFSAHGPVKVEDGKIILESGAMTGVNFTNAIPRVNYEIELDAMRVDGGDFFCGLTFPVKENPCSFIVGGWGGGVVGLSSLDGEDAAHNETMQVMKFDDGRWYHIRLRVTAEKIQAWIDKEQVVDVSIADRNIGIRIELELSKPLGIATYSTTGAIKNIRMHRI